MEVFLMEAKAVYIAMVMKQLLRWFKHIDTQTSTELVQMDMNKIMTKWNIYNRFPRTKM